MAGNNSNHDQNAEHGWHMLPDLVRRGMERALENYEEIAEAEWLNSEASPFRMIVPFERELDRMRADEVVVQLPPDQSPACWTCTSRKARLLAVAVAYRTTHDFPDTPARRHFLGLIGFSELYADGLVSFEQLDAAAERVLEVSEGWSDGTGPISRDYAARLARHLRVRPHVSRKVAVRHVLQAAIGTAFVVTDTEFAPFSISAVMYDALVAAAAGGIGRDARRTARGLTTGILGASDTMAALIRDIFGNPFRPVTVDSSWLTSTVTAVAQQMYDSRDFSAMPILADALQDADCDDARILNHCRGATIAHSRGCWVVDLVLGKE